MSAAVIDLQSFREKRRETAPRVTQPMATLMPMQWGPMVVWVWVPVL